MKMLRSTAVCLAAILLSVSLVHGQDLSKYRGFSLGESLTALSNQVNARPADASVIQQSPALIQELTWWPSQRYQPSGPSQSVENILFSFYNGQLYKIAVTYDTTSTQGLKAADMIDAISAEYGLANRPIAKTVPTEIPEYSDKPATIASWEDAQYSLTLFRSPVLNQFQLVMFSKQMNGQAETTIAAAAVQARDDAPQIASARAKQEAKDLETTRQANLKAFRP
jgi:hypothetical protein